MKHKDISEASVGSCKLAAKAGASPKDQGQSPQFAHRAVANKRLQRVGNTACLVGHLTATFLVC